MGKKLLRVRFYSNAPDPRPVNWPIPHPYWISGYTGYAGEQPEATIIISYASNLDYIKQNWPEATDIDAEEVDGYVFTDRFPKPEWFEENNP